MPEILLMISDATTASKRTGEPVPLDAQAGGSPTRCRTAAAFLSTGSLSWPLQWRPRPSAASLSFAAATLRSVANRYQPLVWNKGLSKELN